LKVIGATMMWVVGQLEVVFFSLTLIVMILSYNRLWRIQFDVSKPFAISLMAMCIFGIINGIVSILVVSYPKNDTYCSVYLVAAGTSYIWMNTAMYWFLYYRSKAVDFDRSYKFKLLEKILFQLTLPLPLITLTVASFAIRGIRMEGVEGFYYCHMKLEAVIPSLILAADTIMNTGYLILFLVPLIQNTEADNVAAAKGAAQAAIFKFKEVIRTNLIATIVSLLINELGSLVIIGSVHLETTTMGGAIADFGSIITLLCCMYCIRSAWTIDKQPISIRSHTSTNNNNKSV